MGITSTVSTGAGHVAEIVTLPARRGADSALSGARQVWSWTRNEVDDWGRDHSFAERMWALSQLRWDIAVGGVEHLPTRAGALVIVNARRLALAPVYSALAIGAATGRPVRFVGRPDIAPVGPVLQRLGGLLTRPDELRGALRAGEIVVLGAAHSARGREVGRVDHRLVGAAVEAGVKVFPAATVSAPTRRGVRLEIGSAARSARRRRGPLTELELTDIVTVRLRAMLEEMGGTLGTVYDWIPLVGDGGER